MQIGPDNVMGRKSGMGNAAGDLRGGDAVVRKEKGEGGSSPGCISRLAQSIVRPSSRGGVPVFSRPI